MSLAQVGSLIEICNRESRQLHHKAVVHKWLSNCGTLLVILGSTSAGIISAINGRTIPEIVIAFLVAALESVILLYTPEKRAMIYERISIEINRISRKLRKLDTAEPNQELVARVLDKALNRLDELKIRQFGGEEIDDKVIRRSHDVSQA